MYDEMLKAIQSNPQDYEAWMRMAVALGIAGDGAGLKQLLLFRNALGLSGVELAYEAVCYLIGNRLADRFEAVAATVADNDPFSGAFLVGRAYVDFLDFRLDSGVRWLREGFRRLLLLKQTCPDEALPPDHIGPMACNAFLFEPSDWVPQSLEVKAPLRPLIDATQDGVGPFYVAFADAPYFLWYARRFMTSLRQFGSAEAPVILGIVNPTPEALALAQSLAAEDSRLMVLGTEYHGDYLPEFCSAARLVHGADLLARLVRPTLFFDIDTAFPEGAAAMLETIASHPLACIRTDKLLPQLSIDASVIGAHPDERAMAFFRRAETYVLGKLREKGPLWTFDQVALYRSVAALYAAGDSIVDIAECGGADKLLPAFFKSDHAASLDSRKTTRSNSRVVLARVAPDGQPIFKDIES